MAYTELYIAGSKYNVNVSSSNTVEIKTADGTSSVKLLFDTLGSVLEFQNNLVRAICSVVDKANSERT